MAKEAPSAEGLLAVCVTSYVIPAGRTKTLVVKYLRGIGTCGGCNLQLDPATNKVSFTDTDPKRVCCREVAPTTSSC